MPAHHPLIPKLFTVFRAGYSREQFVADLTAGTIVGIVALPLAIAFAIASGVKPEQGLFTAVIAGVVVSAFGGSRVQIAGPTGAFIVIVYGVVRTYGYDGLAVATLIAGVILIVMGLARLGTLLKFVPYPLTVGFTSGIALIIFSSQVNDFLGLGITDLPADFVGKWAAYASHAGTVDPGSLAVGAASLAIILLAQRFFPRLPGSLLSILCLTAVVQLLHLPVETIGSRFGSVPSILPAPRLPEVSWETITRVFSPAVTIAMLGSIESLLSAVVADGMIRSRHRSNIELIAQGAANVLSPLFSGIPATGAIARTATNVKSGGRTPVAGIVHAIVLLLIMMLFGQWAALIPMPTLAAILLVVAYNMSEWHSFVKTFRAPRSDIAVMLVTFALTVIVDLTVAIQVGVILSAMLFIRRMAEVSHVTPLTKDLNEGDEAEEDLARPKGLPDGVEVFEVHGTLFFGAVEQFTETMRALEKTPKVFILETRNLLAIDATGIRAIEDLVSQLTHGGTKFILSGIHKQPLFAITQAGVLDRIGEGNVCGTLAEALERARSLTENAR
ncbi:MAG: sodium-independent anion transporter [candidate division NC10 bacterium]|nr:sodium-independent anion transporter [candidate division NC10 bacterium]